MSAERGDWADAFLRQGISDLGVHDLLASTLNASLPHCHALHYLQMACEKLAKAYRIRDTSAALHGENGLLRKHVGFSKFMSAFLLSPVVKRGYTGRTKQLEEVRRRALALAREVEKLAPAVDDESAPANAEYPWQAGEKVVAPYEYDFPNLSLLRGASGRTFLKLVHQAAREFDTASLS